MPDNKQPNSSKVDVAMGKVSAEINKIPPTTDRNLMAALSYVWILSLVMLVVKRGDAFVQFHAKQGVVLLIISILASVLLWVPVLGFVAWALSIAGMVIGFVHAWQGKEYKLPYIYGWSQKIHL